jgi:Skp family chaperone for outer membrane proteins
MKTAMQALLPCLLVPVPVAAMAQALPTVGQTAPATQGQPLGGPLVAGVCLLSREALFSNAKISLAASARLKQLSDAAQVEVDAKRKPIDADLEAFEQGAAKLPADQREQRRQALATRLQPVQELIAQRNREIEATRAKALARISSEAQPVIALVYGQHKCGLLVDRTMVLGGNFGNDLTADVVHALDAKVATISFEREILPPPAPK